MEKSLTDRAGKAERRLHHSFRLKITLSFIILLLVFMFAIAIEMYCYTRQAMVEKTRTYMRSAAEACSVNIDSSIREIEDVTLSIIGNATIQAALDSSARDDLTYYEQYQLTQSIQDYLSSYALLRLEVQSLCIQSTSGEVYSYSKNRQPFQEMLEAHEEELYQLDGKVKWFISNPEGTMLSCARAINSLSDLSTIGIVTVNIAESYIRSFYSEMTLPAAGEVYIIDGDNTIISSYNGENLGSTIDEAFWEVLDGGGDTYTELDNGDTVYASDWMTNRWRLVMTIPASYYMSGVARIGVIIFLSAIIMAVIAAALVSMMAKHLTRPINELACAMTDFGNGDFNVRSTVNSSDEIGILSDTFNRMVEDMNNLCDRVYEQQILRQDAELKTLQMQINPHFLYNTLDTINWMSRAKGVDDVGEMAYALGCLLRHSLSRGDFTTLEHELNALEYYLKIQNYRYSDKLTAVIDIDPSFYNIDIPKLLIQPIVENAIVHGIEEKLDSGTVRIWAEMDGTRDVLIRVEDDGVGMSPETLQRILRNTQDTGYRGRPHIGVANVDKRFLMYYGEGYGLVIQSELGKGTRVTLRIKALREPPDAEPM